MRTPEELKKELQEDDEAVKVIDVNWPNDIDPTYLMNHPLEAIVLDEETGHVERRPINKWRAVL
jgi:hypothetical protein